jgi:hypothetical protein
MPEVCQKSSNNLEYVVYMFLNFTLPSSFTSRIKLNALKHVWLKAHCSSIQYRRHEMCDIYLEIILHALKTFIGMSRYIRLQPACRSSDPPRQAGSHLAWCVEYLTLYSSIFTYALEVNVNQVAKETAC